MKKIFSPINKTSSLGSYLPAVMPDPDPLMHTAGISYQTLRELCSDAHLYAVRQQRLAGCLGMQTRIIPGEADSGIVSFINRIFSGISPDRLIPQILDAVFLGMSVLWIDWHYRDGYLLPEKIYSRPQEDFCFDETGTLRLRDDFYSPGSVPPRNVHLLIQHQADHNNPYGEKALSRCYWPVQFKRNGYQFWVTFIEKYGMPFLAAKQPRSYTDEETARLLVSLEKMMQDTYGILPDDSSVEFIQGSQSSTSEVFRKFLDFCNNEISKAILSQTLTTDIQERGTNAAARTHELILQRIILSDKRLVEQTMNSLIDIAVRLNFPEPAPRPRFELYAEVDNLRATAERDRILRQQGVRFTKEYYMRYYNFREDEFEI